MTDFDAREPGGPDGDAVTAHERAFYEAQYSSQVPVATLVAEPLSRREIFALQLLGDCRGKRILDLGCGTGRHAGELAAAGATVLAVDLTLRGLQAARQVTAAMGVDEGICFVCMDGHALAVPQASVDLVFGAQILHHLDCRRAGAEVNRVLRPGGRAVFIENSSRNRLLMLVRRLLMGRLGVHRYGSADEMPLGDDEIEQFRAALGGVAAGGGHVQVHFPQLCLAVLLARHWLSTPWAMQALLAVDRLLDRAFPALRPWGFLQVLEFTKNVADDSV